MSRSPAAQSILDRVAAARPTLTPKAQDLADFVVRFPGKVVFMTTRELSGACGTSESTVVRFVAQVGFAGYTEFVQALRDAMDAELSIVDRLDLARASRPDVAPAQRVILAAADDLGRLFETLDLAAVGRLVDALAESPAVYVVGARVSYAVSYYLGWALTKLRSRVHLLVGSDSTAIDWLTLAPAGSLVVIVATSRYPNDLVRLGRLAGRLGLTLAVVADGPLCPLLPMAHVSLVTPSRHISFVGSLAPMMCVVDCLAGELASRDPEGVRRHQEKLEASYRENDVMFHVFEPQGTRGRGLDARNAKALVAPSRRGRVRARGPSPNG